MDFFISSLKRKNILFVDHDTFLILSGKQQFIVNFNSLSLLNLIFETFFHPHVQYCSRTVYNTMRLKQ